MPRLVFFAWNLRVVPVEKTLYWYKRIGYIIRGTTSNHVYTLKGGWETLVYQRMHVLMIQCHISLVDMVLKIGCFCLKFEHSFGRNNTVMTTRRSDMLLEALPAILIHLREVEKHSSSNGCMSLRYNITFYLPILCPQIGYDFAWNLRVPMAEKTLCWP